MKLRYQQYKQRHFFNVTHVGLLSDIFAIAAVEHEAAGICQTPQARYIITRSQLDVKIASFAAIT